jgi:hypothetical protein
MISDVMFDAVEEVLGYLENDDGTYKNFEKDIAAAVVAMQRVAWRVGRAPARFPQAGVRQNWTFPPIPKGVSLTFTSF